MAAILAALATALLGSGCASVRNTSRTFDTVVIDAGHGGHDSGAVSRRGTREKDVNLDVSLRLDHNLRTAGFQTVLTRGDDRFISLGERSQVSNREKNAVFVSVHFNSSPNRGARGMETHYHHPYGRGLAGKIQSRILLAGNAPDRGVKKARFSVLRKNLNPAVLVECAFLSNSSDDRLARSAAHRQLLADRIAQALFEQRFGGSMGLPASSPPAFAGPVADGPGRGAN